MPQDARKRQQKIQRQNAKRKQRQRQLLHSFGASSIRLLNSPQRPPYPVGFSPSA